MPGFLEPYLLVLVASAMYARDVTGGIVSCDPDPCKNSILCRTTMLPEGVTYNCVCLPGFSGETCEIKPPGAVEESEQATNSPTSTADSTGDAYCSIHKPCQNGGSCIDGVTENDYQCDCPMGFEGKDCQIIPVLPTISPTSTADSTGDAYCSIHKPCQNGGSCIDGVTENDYQCDCPMGFEGKDCQITTQPEGTKEIVLTDDSCERKVSVGIPQVTYMATLGCEEGTILVKSASYGSGTHWNAWIEQIGKICNAQTQCKVAAKDDMLDDPFMRVYKRLIIVYECLT